MAKRSPLQQISDNVFDRIKSLRDTHVEGEVPFGFEQIDKATAKRKFEQMSSEQKKKVINQLGVDNILKFVR